MMVVDPLRAAEVLAAGEHCRASRSRIGKDFPGRAVPYHMPCVHNEKLLGEAVYLIPVVGHHDHHALVILQHVVKLPLHPVPQIPIEGGERFVEQNHIRPIGHDPCQRAPLLLSARELPWQPVLKAAEAELGNHLICTGHLRVFTSGKSRHDIFPHCHIGKQSVILEKIPYVPHLRFQIDASG